MEYLEEFVYNGYLDAGSNYDLGEVLHMTYLQLERVYLRMRLQLGGKHDQAPTLSELRNINEEHQYCGLGAVGYAASGASELLTRLGMETGAGCCAPAFSRLTTATPAR